jgi:hypothetical protein
LRYVPDCWHHFSKTNHPAIVAPITGAINNELIGAHQTFLNEDGTDKANIEKQRLYFGLKSGGVVRLTADQNVQYGLAIAEGIETAFAGITAGYPTWACLDAGGLATFPLLQGVEALTILVDNDAKNRGEEAARQCAERWATRDVVMNLAPKGNALKADWNDIQREVINA